MPTDQSTDQSTDQRDMPADLRSDGDVNDTPLLTVSGLTRSFGETRALAAAELVVRPGEIHALAGENGSGKTTLIKVLSGVIRPDAGTVTWDGRPAAVHSPAAAQRLGISTVFQETLYAGEQSVVDNVFMGMDGLFRRARTRADEARRASEALTALGLPDLDVRRPLWSLSLAERQLVTIARAVVRPWRLLVLDEGTSALDASQRNQVFEYLRGERALGKSVLFTSHRMDEIDTLADVVSVLRLGATVLRTPKRDITSPQILAAMAGRDAAAARDVRSARPAADRELGAPAITASARASGPASPSMSITVHRGEIFGLAGLEGQGQTEFARSLVGLERPASGPAVVHLDDGRTREVRGFAQTRRLAIAYVPRDRKQEGLFFTRSTLDNFGVAMLAEVARFGHVSRRVLRRRFDEYVPVVRLLAHDPGNLVGTLSGGNQQKVLLARWLATEPRVLVLNDPMRGVDANTKEELYGLLRGLAAKGLAIVLLSTEVLELLALCDRIAVFHDGTVAAVLSASQTTDTDVVAAMFGHTLDVRSEE